MNKYIVSIIALASVSALSSYAWDRSNTHTNYFIDDSTTIAENLAPTKNIHINDQGNFKLKYDENNKGYTDEAAFKASSPIDVVVKSGVAIKAEVYSPNAKANVDATFQVGKANLTLEGNNTITASQMILSDGANVYAENATINLTSSSDRQGLRFAMGFGACKAVFKGGQLNAKSVFVQDDSGSLTFDGTNVVLESITASGNLSNKPTQFEITLKKGTSLTLTETKRIYDYDKNSANTKFDGKLVVEDGATVKSTYEYYKLGASAGISVSGAGSSMEIYNIVSQSEIAVDSGAEIKADKISANDIFVGDNATLIGKSSISAKDTLTVASTAKVNGKDIKFGNLVLEFDENITQDLMKDFDFSSIFGESATVVTASLDNFSVVGTNGTFEASFDRETGGVVVPSAPVPEPATCAAIFGAFALAFAAYRRRR